MSGNEITYDMMRDADSMLPIPGESKKIRKKCQAPIRAESSTVRSARPLFLPRIARPVADPHFLRSSGLEADNPPNITRVFLLDSSSSPSDSESDSLAQVSEAELRPSTSVVSTTVSVSEAGSLNLNIE